MDVGDLDVEARALALRATADGTAFLAVGDTERAKVCFESATECNRIADELAALQRIVASAARIVVEHGQKP
jgi:hypothetical protein